MTASFIAFIDESGDEGFTFHPDGTGSSRWLVLSAAVFRRGVDLEAVKALNAAKATLGWPREKTFHFSDMRHEPRLLLMNSLRPLPFRTISVLSYKPHIPDPEAFQANKSRLYRYLSRILLERLSWLCRDNRKTDEGDGTVDLIFSDRASMSYDDLRGYVSLLRAQSSFGSDVQIHWPAIDEAQIRAVAHSHLAGLQVADAVATATHYAVKLSRLGISDPSYIRLLKGHAYRHQPTRKCHGYGVKFLSSYTTLKKEMPHLDAAFGDW